MLAARATTIKLEFSFDNADLSGNGTVDANLISAEQHFYGKTKCIRLAQGGRCR